MSRLRNLGLFCALAVVWGTAFAATKLGLASIPPILFAAVRFDLAAVLLFAYVFARGVDWRPKTRGDVRHVLVGGAFSIGAHHALLFAGQQTVPPATAAVLLGLIPVITPALTRLAATERRLTPTGFVGVLLGFVGVVIIANPDPSRLLSANVVGVALVLASAVAFAVGAVLLSDEPPSMSVIATQPWMMAVGAVLLHVTALVVPEPAAVWNTDALAALVYLAAVSGALGFFLYFLLLDRLGPIEVSFIEYATPIPAAIGGFVLFGDAVTPATVLGFVIILAGFALVKRRALRAELRRQT